MAAFLLLTIIVKYTQKFSDLKIK